MTDGKTIHLSLVSRSCKVTHSGLLSATTGPNSTRSGTACLTEKEGIVLNNLGVFIIQLEFRLDTGAPFFKIRLCNSVKTGLANQGITLWYVMKNHKIVSDIPVGL